MLAASVSVSGNVLDILVVDVAAAAYALVSTSDRLVSVFSLPAMSQVAQMSMPSPVLAMAALRLGQHVYVVVCRMDGHVDVVAFVAGDSVALRPTAALPSHGKYVVRVAIDHERGLVATAGYDKRINIASVTSSGESEIAVQPLQTIELVKNPESISFVPGGESSSLLVTLRDSPFLDYYGSTGRSPFTLGTRENMNELNDMHVSFSAVDISQRPVTPALLAVATSNTPNGRTIFMPPFSDKITHNCWTGAPQDDYSKPLVRWRPDGTGVYVNGDDGIIRGIHVGTGKVVQNIKAHEGIIRALWSGRVGDEEVLISGGFDRKVKYWRAGQL